MAYILTAALELFFLLCDAPVVPGSPGEAPGQGLLNVNEGSS